VSAEDNLSLLRRAHKAFSANDAEAAIPMFAEDAVWHAPGKGALAGVKRGRDDVLAYSAELLTRSADVLTLDVHDVVAGDDHGVSLLHQHAERDGEVLDQHIVLVVHTRDGRFTEVWEFHEDDAEYDRFWG
jgi:uncharacterized protein